jgi:outer membrane lipoprotein-sorting protein
MTMTKALRCASLVLASLPLGLSIVHAQATPPPTAAQVASGMQATYGASSAFSADFAQVYNVKFAGKKLASNGHVTFEQPDRFLFEYATPKGDVTVSDGKTIRMYVAAQKKSCEGPVTASMIPGAFAFLSGKKSLAVDFNLTLLPPATCAFPSGHCLVAKPKVPTTSYDFLKFLVDGKQLVVERVTVVDAQGNSNRFDFTGASLTPKLKPGIFLWKPPAGTTIKPLTAC